MAVVIASDLGKDIAGEPLLRGISFKLERHDRMTLSGRNGAGKTTLLRMLSGEALIDFGELVLAKDTKIALHDQRPPRDLGLSLREYVLSGARELDVAPALVVGYSMGGAVAQLMARDFPDAVAGLVLSGTAQHWQDPQTRRVFKAMGALGLMLSVAPRRTWTAGFHRVGISDSPDTAWALSEVIRHSARDIAEAGRELGRFDSRPWLSPLPIPAAVVLTTRDDAVAPAKQRALAAALDAPIFEAPISHMQITTSGADYNPALLRALAVVGGRDRAAAA